MSVAPFGWPVVPLVYWMSATSSAPGDAIAGLIRSDCSSFDHGMVPLTLVVRAARESRAFLIGSRSRARVMNGIARVMSTEMIESTATSSGKAWMVATILSHAITTFAPWSSNWWRSSRGVYSGLCSTTIAPSRSTA